MADKQIEIEVVTRTDLSGVDDLRDAVEDVKSAAGDPIELETNAEEVSSEFDDLGTSAENAATSVDGAGDSVSNIDGSNVSGAATEFDGLADSAQSAGSAVDDLQSSMDLIEASALMSISNELSSIGSNAEGMAQEMNTAAISVGQLATQTGIAEPQMVSLINNISNATFPNDEAMMYVKSLDQMGVASSNLGESATNIDRINDAFGLGASRTNSLAQELGVLGVDMNDVSSAFNALAYANANTVGGMENYYTFLRKYDAQFNELGYDVDQASMIIAAATQKYGGGRAALSGLSEALKEADGDTRKLEEALGMQAGSLDNASQITGEYAGQLEALAGEEAEHKTFLDQLGAAWEDLSLSLSPVLSPLASFMGIIGQVGSWAVGINGIITLVNTIRDLEIIGSITGAFSSLWGVLIANPIILVVVAVAALVAALVWAYYNVDWFREMVDNAFGTLMEFASGIYNSIAGAIQWLGDLFNDFTSQIGLNTSDWRQAILGFILFIPQLPLRVGQLLLDTIAEVLGFGPDFTNSMIQAATDAVDGFVTKFWEIIDYVQSVLQSVVDYILTLGGLIPEGVNITGNQIVDSILAVMIFIETLPLQIAMIFINIIAQVLGFGANFSQNMITGAFNAVNGFITWISQIPARALAFFNSTIGHAASFASNLISRVVNGAANAASQFGSQIAQIPQRLGAELGNALNKVNEWAATLPAKFWEAGVNAVKNFLSALGINSPGTMQRMLVWEVSEMGRRVPYEARDVISNIGQVGRDIVDSFGNPKLGVDFETANAEIMGSVDAKGNGGYGNTINLNLEIGTVDSEDRVQEIVEVIRKELTFNNATAGRTV